MDRPFGWDYPPGVTGSEPEITGEPPIELDEQDIVELEEEEGWWEDEDDIG